MKMPRPRFTVRGLMITVAMLAVGFGATSWVARMRDRSAAFRQLAFEFKISTLRSASMVQTADGRWLDRNENENDRLRDAWAWRMEAEYLHLSYYPWLAPEPDPPQPPPLAHPRRSLDLPAREHSDNVGTCPAPAALDVPVDLASAGIGTAGVSRARSQRARPRSRNSI